MMKRKCIVARLGVGCYKSKLMTASTDVQGGMSLLSDITVGHVLALHVE